MKKDVTPCVPNSEITAKIDGFAEELKAQAHLLGSHGLSEQEFYASGLFDGTIERIRGQKSASLEEKKRFTTLALNFMQDEEYIKEWVESGGANRYDLSITLNSGRVAVIELKGCLDGNNTNISDRPAHADEFIIWSQCQNKTSDIKKGVWSGIHTRMSADITDLGKRIDGLIVWDFICNTIARPCPKIKNNQSRVTALGAWKFPPPCLFSFPATCPEPRNNPKPTSREVASVEILQAFYNCFGGLESELNKVEFEADIKGRTVRRKTTVIRDGKIRRASRFTPIKRR